MFDILDLPEEALKKVLPKAPTYVLVRLLTAYPRAVSQVFMKTLSQTISAATMAYLIDRINTTQLPTVHQIRQAERELIKLVHDEKPFPAEIVHS